MMTSRMNPSQRRPPFRASGPLLALGLFLVSEAFASPPPHAPAHGWRAQQERQLPVPPPHAPAHGLRSEQEPIPSWPRYRDSYRIDPYQWDPWWGPVVSDLLRDPERILWRSLHPNWSGYLPPAGGPGQPDPWRDRGWRY